MVCAFLNVLHVNSGGLVIVLYQNADFEWLTGKIHCEIDQLANAEVD